MPHIFLEVGVIGIGPTDGFEFDISRPAQHCRLCGDSFQPWLARDPAWLTDGEVKLAVDILIAEWRVKHAKTHSPSQHKEFEESGRFMTPEAAMKLIPLGIYPLEDLMFDKEVAQAGREAPRAPSDDIPDHLGNKNF